MFRSFVKNTPLRLAWLGLPLYLSPTLAAASPQLIGPDLGLFLESSEGIVIPENGGFQFASIAITSTEMASGFYVVPDGWASCADIETFIDGDPDGRGADFWQGWNWLRDPFSSTLDGVDPSHLSVMFPQDGSLYDYSPLPSVVDPYGFLVNMERAAFMESDTTALQQWFQPILTPLSPGLRSTYWSCFYPRWAQGGPSESYWRRIHAGGVDGAKRNRSLVSSTAWVRTLIYRQALDAGIILPSDFFASHYVDLVNAGLQVDVQGHAIRGRFFEGQAALLFPDRDDPLYPLAGLTGNPPHRKSNTPKKRFPILGDLPPGSGLMELNQQYGTKLGEEAHVPRNGTFVFKYPYFGGTINRAHLEFSDGTSDWAEVRMSGFTPGTPLGFVHGDLCELTIPGTAALGPCRIMSLITMNGSSQTSFSGPTSSTYSLIVE